MSRFGRGVRRGRRIARRAIRSRIFRTSFSKSPFYWAGFLVSYFNLASGLPNADRVISAVQLIGNSPVRGGILGGIGAFGRGMLFNDMLQAYMKR